ncbi:MAG: alpha/beta hydrolase [Cyanobacteria bacterium P01_H01_bin.121]
MTMSSLSEPKFATKPDCQLNALWLTLNPSLKRLDQRVLCQLYRRTKIHRWEYHQTPDEPCCLETIIGYLHETLTTQAQPLHLLGHGISGTVALLYAQRYPQHVRSLTLLAVGQSPGVTWHSHYYAMRELLPCDRHVLLSHLARMMLGNFCPHVINGFAKLLELDLDEGFAPHSLAGITSIDAQSVEPPVLVCYGQHDLILSPQNYTTTDCWLKPTDQIWQCPEGKHFFHFAAPEQVAKRIYDYWQNLPNHTHAALAGHRE